MICNSFLQSGAIKNNTKIIVYYNQLFPSTQVQFIYNGTPADFRGIGSTAVIRDPTRSPFSLQELVNS